MKKLITNRYITLVIYALLFIMVLIVWLWEITEFDDFLKKFNNWNQRLDLANVLYGLKITNNFTASITCLVLGIALFLKNKIGWILITGWFYFILTNAFRTFFEEGIYDISRLFRTLLLFLIPILFILLMNKFNGIHQYHKIEKNKKLKLNLWAIGIGFFLAFFRILKKYLLQQGL